MRRRLLVSTFGIAFACVVILGVPLALLARREVWTSAHDRLRGEASSIGTALEDQLDARQPLNLGRYLQVLHDRRIVVRSQHRLMAQAGPTWRDPIEESVAVADATITVQAPRGPIVARAREVTLLVAGLGTLAIMAAVALALWQARRLARPLAQLANRADELGRGEFAGAPVCSGVPEIDQVSSQLERSAHQLAEVISLQQQFASDAAHQLRTPLTGIGLHLDEISRIGGETVRADAEDALTQVERLNGVISSLLARARGDAADPELLDLAQLLTEGAAPWQHVLAQAGRRLELELPPDIPVRVRREHVLGALTSLLDNAVVHGEGAVRVMATVADGAAEVRVSDDGGGVPERLRASLFDRHASGVGGTGIGLALARSLVAAERGTLSLSSQRPSEFILVLPVLHP